MTRLPRTAPLALALALAFPATAAPTIPPPRAEPLVAAPGDATYVARIERFDATRPSDNGSIRHHVVVLRDVTPSRDDKVVVVLAEVDQAPAYNGVLYNDEFRPNGASVKLFIPDAYRVSTQLGLHGDGAPTAIPVAISPMSDGATDRTITDKVTVRTSNGAGTKTELVSALLKAGASVDGKLPLDLNDSSTRTEE